MSRTGLTSTFKEVFHLKIADVLEDHLDQGLGYIPAKQLVSGTDNQTWILALVNLAGEVGAVDMATELQALFEESRQRHVPNYLVNASGGSIMVAPRSHRERIMTRMSRKYHRWLGKIKPVA